MNSIIYKKASLRKEVLNILTKIDTHERNRQSQEVFRKLILLPQFQMSKRVSLYLSTNQEIDTIPILKEIFASGKQAFIPRYKGKEMVMVKISSMMDYDRLPLTKWNIKQPKPNEVRENAIDNGGLDLILVPGVAFTKEGERLGHGMGYYDKYLKQIGNYSTNVPSVIGLALNEQIFQYVPTDENDFKLDMVLTEKN